MSGLEDGLAIAGRLAARNGALIRWAAMWTDGPRRSDLVSHFGSRPSLCVVDAESGMVCVRSPTMDDVRHLAARAGPDPLCVHWSPASYTFDEGPDAPWISFVDPYGREREDARVYGIELACNAVPLTTDDRPWRRSSGPGPDPATGWVLRIETIRDHMPSEQLVLRLSADASVPVGSIARVELD